MRLCVFLEDFDYKKHIILHIVPVACLVQPFDIDVDVSFNLTVCMELKKMCGEVEMKKQKKQLFDLIGQWNHKDTNSV